MCYVEAEAARYLCLCKDRVDDMIIFLRIEGKSIDDIAKELGLKRLKSLGFVDSYNVIERGKSYSLFVGTLGEYLVDKALKFANISHEWCGIEVGNHPDFRVFNGREKWLEVKNFKDGHYITSAEAERDIVSRFKKCKSGEKMLLITNGVEIRRDAWEVLKKNKIRVYRIGWQITDDKWTTVLKVFFRLKRVGVIADSSSMFTVIEADVFGGVSMAVVPIPYKIDILNTIKCVFVGGDRG